MACAQTSQITHEDIDKSSINMSINRKSGKKWEWQIPFSTYKSLVLKGEKC